MDSQTFLLRKCLYQISNHLGHYEVEKIKFMLDDDLPRALLETARSGFDVFCLMEEKGFLSPTKVDFLAEVLDTVSKKHYIDRYINVRVSPGEVFKPIPAAAVGAVSDRTKIPSHKILLGKLGDGLTPENVHDMALFFHGEPSSIQLRDIENFKTAEKIFQKLQSSRMIQPGNYTLLYNVLEVLGRLDLCEMIAEYCSSLSRGEATTPQKDTGHQLQHPIPVQDNEESHYVHNPPSHFSTLGNSSSSGPTTNSSMESRDGIGQPYLYVGERTTISSSMPLPSSDSHTPTDPKIIELEADKQKLQEQLAVAVKQARVEHDQRVQELEHQLRQKNKEVEELRQQANRLNQVAEVSHSLAYTMDKSPHGIALVIVNEKFDKSQYDPTLDLYFREGARHDKQLFRDTFTALNYKVEVFANLTAIQMLEKINSLANQDHSNHDSVVLCLSTHGVNKGVYGSDSVLVRWQEIDMPIKQSPTLRGKPKLFFFQSCRCPPPEVKADGLNSPSAQEDADMFKVFASGPNQAAYISPHYGSWLAMSMKRHFTDPQLMYTHNLGTLMNLVSDEVVRQVGSLVEGGNMTEVQQCVHRETTLTKAVYFFPPQRRTMFSEH